MDLYEGIFWILKYSPDIFGNTYSCYTDRFENNAYKYIQPECNITGTFAGLACFAVALLYPTSAMIHWHK